ncbi:type VI secretion system baseplate subunit TssG [Sphingomonas arantia]|uniref:Type VI secretion system baseplate subunit TssG n=1 Tax=Sphingomonas arantia TaxID=1460676 RepID=A0ABW4U183_9SPHN
MASAPRPASHHLSYLRRAAVAVSSISPLALLRGAEARAPELPRIGNAKRPDDDIAALVHTPSLAFPAATLNAISIGDAQATIAGNWFGLTGPMGPLPLHLTEYASSEQRYGHQQPFGRFLDVLSARMLQLFYRAWASSVPAASADRPDDDDFGEKVAALTGALDGAAIENAFRVKARLRYAALFASPRSPSGIADALSDLIRSPVRIVEHVERWRDVAPPDRSWLGTRFAGLGREALAGGRICTADEAFKVVVYVTSARELEELLPGGARYVLLAEAINAFAPPHLEWEIELAVAGAAIRPARLGGSARLGWTSWNGPVEQERIRSDVRLGGNARRLAHNIITESAA